MNKEDYSKYYIQGSDHYLIPKDVFDELFNELVNWRQESKELKKQLEEFKEMFEDSKTYSKQFLYKHNKNLLKVNEKLYQKNQQLKEKINTYENPEDLTLMFMYCDAKAKDKIKQLQATNESLTSLVNSCQEEIRKYKEVIEAVNNIIKMKKRTLGYDTNDSYLRSIEEILDKIKEVG